jgi:hypothetical protein
VRWITDADRVIILAFSTAITPTMTQADVDTLVSSMNDYWRTHTWKTTNVYPPVQPTHNGCVADCEKVWMQTGMAVCALIARFNPGWGAKCAAAMLVGYGVCRATCPADPPGPFEFVWCRKSQPQGFPSMDGHPENCGPDPDALVKSGCALIAPPVTYSGYIDSRYGGFQRWANCYWNAPSGPEMIPGRDAAADLWVICNYTARVRAADLVYEWTTYGITDVQQLASRACQ